MGQKVNPVGLRIGISRDWNSRWYANNKDFATFLDEDIKIRKFLEDQLTFFIRFGCSLKLGNTSWLFNLFYL